MFSLIRLRLEKIILTLLVCHSMTEKNRDQLHGNLDITSIYLQRDFARYIYQPLITPDANLLITLGMAGVELNITTKKLNRANFA